MGGVEGDLNWVELERGKKEGRYSGEMEVEGEGMGWATTGELVSP